MRQHGNADALRSRTQWLIAAVLAATWAPDVRAHDIGRSGDTSAPLAQIARSDSPASQDAEGQEHEKAEMLARELAATKRDLEVLVKFLNRACDESTRTRQAADRETTELRKALQEERDRAERKERDLAAMRCRGEPQGAPATRTGDEIAPSKGAADAGSADLQKSLQQEHDRASGLEQDLAVARRDVETQTALAAKAGAEASQLKKTTDAAAADMRKSLQQERDRAAELERDLALARNVDR